MKDQNFKNHARFVPGFHFVMSALILLVLALAIINMIGVWGNPNFLIAGVTPVLIALTLALAFFFIRSFAVKVQDRAIRAEENLRHYVRNGKLIDHRLTMGQVIALRFASDDEYDELANRAITENMKPSDIKKAILTWRADHHRV